MKIGTRLFIALAVPIAILITLFAFLEDRADRARSRDEVVHEGRTIARTVQIATANALRDRQRADVRNLIHDISHYESVLGVRLYDADGRLTEATADLAGVPVPAADTIRARAQSGRIREERFAVAGRPIIAWLAPLGAPAQPQVEPIGAVEVLQLESFIDEDAAASSRAIVAFGAALMAAIALMLFVITRLSVAAPIEALVRNVRGVSLGERSARVPVRRRDELGGLALEFNRMCERLEHAHDALIDAQEERSRIESNLLEVERLAAFGRFAAGLAHEIGTPLNVIRGRAAMLRRRAHDPAMQSGLETIVGQIDRISRIVSGVLGFARAGSVRLVPTDVADVVARVIELVEPRFEAQGMRIEHAYQPGLPPLAADADRLQQVFLNLILNAGDAMSAGGTLHIGVHAREHVTDEEGTLHRACIAIEFADSGTGIAPEHLPRIFDPFFTTKEVGHGTGLGLSVSYGFVREHGGWITATSEPGHGARVTVHLPLESVAIAATGAEVAS